MINFFLRRLKKLSVVEIFVAIFIITSTVFFIKFFGLKEDTRLIRVEVVRKNFVENYDPLGYRTPFWLSDKLKVGQTEKNSVGQVIASIVNMENYTRDNEETGLYLTLKVTVVLNRRTGQYSFKDKPFANGQQIELNLGENYVLGQIIDTNVPENGYPVKIFTVTARGRGIRSSVYSKIIPGARMIDRSSGLAAAEITSVKIEPSSIQPIKFDPTNRFLISDQTVDEHDVIITVKVTAYQLDQRWFFAGHQNLKVGQDIYLYTDQVNLPRYEITDINEL